MKHGKIIMPFGKHKGQRMEDVPASYCNWLWNNCTLNPALRAAVAEKLGIRDEKPEPKLDVGRWFRTLAVEFHPDRIGGNKLPMQVVERARKVLLEQLNG